LGFPLTFGRSFLDGFSSEKKISIKALSRGPMLRSLHILGDFYQFRVKNGGLFKNKFFAYPNGYYLSQMRHFPNFLPKIFFEIKTLSSYPCMIFSAAREISYLGTELNILV
jgi:hypothetical protein